MFSRQTLGDGFANVMDLRVLIGITGLVSTPDGVAPRARRTTQRDIERLSALSALSARVHPRLVKPLALVTTLHDLAGCCCADGYGVSVTAGGTERLRQMDQWE